MPLLVMMFAWNRCSGWCLFICRSTFLGVEFLLPLEPSGELTVLGGETFKSLPVMLIPASTTQGIVTTLCPGSWCRDRKTDRANAQIIFSPRSVRMSRRKRVLIGVLMLGVVALAVILLVSLYGGGGDSGDGAESAAVTPSLSLSPPSL